jgi:hypothetical protein
VRGLGVALRLGIACLAALALAYSARGTTRALPSRQDAKLSMDAQLRTTPRSPSQR